jgi:hypothetical protein
MPLLSAVFLLCCQQLFTGAFASDPSFSAAADTAPAQRDGDEERDSSEERESKEENDSDEDEKIGGSPYDLGAQPGLLAVRQNSDDENALASAYARDVFRPPETART